MRFLGITLPDNKRMEIALTTLHGVGRSQAQRILTLSKVDFAVKAPELTADQEAKIKKFLEELKLEGDLKREISANIKRLKDIKAYRGLRHIKSLPVRGQRTKTNSRTRRGNLRKTAGTGRRAVDKK